MIIPTFMVKLLELTFAVICLILHQYSYDLTDLSTLMLCSGTYVGFVVILSGEIVGELTLLQLDVIQDMFFGLIGVILFATCGSLVLQARLGEQPVYPRTGDHVFAVAEGGVAIGNAVMMFFDLSLAYLDSEEYERTRELISAGADAYVEAWWCASGGALFGTCGTLTLKMWREVPRCERRQYAQLAAASALANAVLLGLDALMSLCSATKDDLSTVKSIKSKSRKCTSCV